MAGDDSKRSCEYATKFFKNMILFRNVHELLKIWSEFGFDPDVRVDIDKSKLTNIREVQDYFVGDNKSKQSEAYRAMKNIIKACIDKDERISSHLGRRSMRMGCLYLPPSSKNMTSDEPSIKMLDLLYIHIANKAMVLLKLKDEERLQPDELKQAGLYEFGVKQFRNGPRRGREGLEWRAGDAGDFAEIDTIDVFSHTGPTQLYRLVDSFFKMTRGEGKRGKSYDEKLVFDTNYVRKRQDTVSKKKKEKRVRSSTSSTEEAGEPSAKKVVVAPASSKKTDGGIEKSNTSNKKAENANSETVAGVDDNHTATTTMTQPASHMINRLQECFKDKSDESVRDSIVQVVTVIDGSGEDGEFGELHKMLFKNSEGTAADSSNENSGGDEYEFE